MGPYSIPPRIIPVSTHPPADHLSSNISLLTMILGEALSLHLFSHPCRGYTIGLHMAFGGH